LFAQTVGVFNGLSQISRMASQSSHPDDEIPRSSG
jgi:hypothetical protein